MQLRLGYEISYECPQPTPMLLMLNIHYTRAADIVVPDHIITTPTVPVTAYRDMYGNWCSRLVAPAGVITFTTDAIVNTTGQPDPVVGDARQHAVQDLPEETLQFLLGSRYCETDLMSATAWSLFGNASTGWWRVQAICDYVHRHISFGYEHAHPTKTAQNVFNSRRGVCRDFTHLAVTFCRCMNIPARYCTGYLSDIGETGPFSPMDFAAWFEVYLGGRWHMFDVRNNKPRIGRVLIAQGRDAADVAISNTFGLNTLKSFKVWTDEHVGPDPRQPTHAGGKLLPAR